MCRGPRGAAPSASGGQLPLGTRKCVGSATVSEAGLHAQDRWHTRDEHTLPGDGCTKPTGPQVSWTPCPTPGRCDAVSPKTAPPQAFSPSQLPASIPVLTLECCHRLQPAPHCPPATSVPLTFTAISTLQTLSPAQATSSAAPERPGLTVSFQSINSSENCHSINMQQHPQ